MVLKDNLGRLEGCLGLKFLRKVYCKSCIIGIMLLLVCSVGLILFCFVLVDVKVFYDSGVIKDFVLWRGLEFNFLVF